MFNVGFIFFYINKRFEIGPNDPKEKDVEIQQILYSV